MTQGSPGPEAPVGQQGADPGRSGADVVEAVQTAADGTPHGGVQTGPDRTKPHAAPVEQVRGDPAMTGGQVVDGPGTRPDTPAGPSPAEVGSGGAQSIVGARVSDRVSAGEPAPEGPPFDEGAP